MTPDLQRFFNALVQPPGTITTVTVGASPFDYIASAPGSVVVTGGTVSAIDITRNTVTLPTGQTAGIFPVATGDIVTITYSVAPDVSFVPS